MKYRIVDGRGSVVISRDELAEDSPIVIIKEPEVFDLKVKSVRGQDAWNRFRKRYKIKTLEEAARKVTRKKLRGPNCGVISVQEIAEALAKYGVVI